MHLTLMRGMLDDDPEREEDPTVRQTNLLLLQLTCALALCTMAAGAQTVSATSPGRKMAETVITHWPTGSSTIAGRGKWAYEEGVLLDGLAAQWQVSHDPALLAYIQASVDKYVSSDGSVPSFNAGGHILDDIEMGRADLFLYRVTHQEKYAKAAKFLHQQLATQPRNASGGYWHKQTYPNQMWLDGAYMAEPFRAAYAATFHTNADFDDIAHQLLLMDVNMRDAKTGLLRHGWDESKAMPWADKTTGLSPEVWARAMGWYMMALVDVLDWFPRDHPQHTALVAALDRNAAAVLRAQDPTSHLWWQVMTHPGEPGNYFEASASCMFTYALAKGVRQGYLPAADRTVARKAWDAINAKFITTASDGTVTLHDTVSVGGLGGKPYRAGDYAYYLSEKVVDNDAKGIGAYMLAASQMDTR
jgi:unsaturated rhamnogalacturonyl hydrolase